jgi:putative hydrolase
MASDRDPFDGETPAGDEQNPLAAFMRQFGIQPGADGTFDLNQLMGSLQQAMGQFSAHMSSFGGSGEGGLNWTFTRDVARKVTASQGPDPSPTAGDQQAVRDAVGLADLWLDESTSFDRVPTPAAAWSRAEWVEKTFDVWQQLCAPVTTSLAAAISGMMGQQGEDMAGLQPMMEPMMRAASAGMLSAQIGQSLGLLSTEVVSVSDISIPLTARPVVALLPANIAKFADGLEQSDADVRLYLALRETARQRLFGSVGWLGPQLLALIEHYARGITIDSSAIEEALESQMNGQMTPEDLTNVGNAVAGKLFTPAKTPEQVEILERLETLVALVEGWVDDVVSDTTSRLMPQAVALLETLRRRRASGGPAEAALKSLLNLELRPRRVRDAANLWAAVRAAQGREARDAVWAHPDLVPTAADLSDPLGFAAHGHQSASSEGFDDLDAELAKLLDEEQGKE